MSYDKSCHIPLQPHILNRSLTTYWQLIKTLLKLKNFFKGWISVLECYELLSNVQKTFEEGELLNRQQLAASPTFYIKRIVRIQSTYVFKVSSVPVLLRFRQFVAQKWYCFADNQWSSRCFVNLIGITLLSGERHMKIIKQLYSCVLC